MNKIKQRYVNNDPRVKEYMDILVDLLEEKYGSVNKEWIITLDLIATNFEVYYKGYDSVCIEGIYTYDKNHNKQRNPGITLQQNTQAYIMKLINSMGWSILSSQKIQAPDKVDSFDDAFDD